MPFRRLVGAAADVKELEYVSALHQTCLPICRENGTVSSIDVVRFLRSRFGLEVPHKHAIGVVRSLGGGTIDEEVINRILEDMYVEEDNLDQGEDTDEGKDRLKFLKGAGAGVGKGVGAFKKRLFKAESERAIQEAKQEALAQEAAVEEEEDEDRNEDVENPEDLPEEYLDLIQLLSIILIPTIARAGKEFKDSLDESNNEEEDVGHVEQGSEELLSKLNPMVMHKKHATYRAEQKSSRKKKELDSLRPKPESLIGDVHSMILGALNDHTDANGEKPSTTPTMSVEFVERLLVAWGEHERAHDKKLIASMVKAAGGEGSVFDEKSFVTALTSDLTEWEVGTEDELTSPHFDVWRFDNLQEKQAVEAEDKEEKQASISEGLTDSQAEGGLIEADADEEDTYVAKYPRMMASIDFAVDCHGSVSMAMLIWAFFVCTALLYTTLFQQIEGTSPDCGADFGCKLAETVVIWLYIAACLSLSGLIIMIPLSFGNTPAIASPKLVIFAFACAAVFTYLPYIIVIYFRNNSEEPYNAAESTVNDQNYDNFQNLTFAIGNAVMFALCLQFIKALIGRRKIRQGSDMIKGIFTSANVRGCRRTKMAGTRKLNAMILNAHSLHPEAGETKQSQSVLATLKGSSSTDETMLNYVLRGERFEECGGLLWTWKRILNAELFDTEGVWINSRIYIIQGAQVILAIVLSYSAFIFTETVADAAEEARESLDDYESLPDWVYDLVPTRDVVYAAFYPATAVLIVVMVAIMLIYIPSATGTTLQYRCGVRPSLRSKMFNTFRKNPDTVYLNIGNAIYAMIGSGVIFFLLVGLFVFLIAWEFTRDFMILIFAWGIGLTITIVLKMAMTMFCRKKFYAAYYRTRPFAANVSLLALECWHVGLGGGVLIGRFTQFILAAAFWVGRIDARFLDEEVNLVGYGFDYVPFNFEKDLLGHDAHRHPYIDRLGCMYMMKLKHGKRFCTNAGACWRQLFVVALMPWMMKHRVFNDKRITDSIAAFAKKKAEEKEEKKNFGENVADFGQGLKVGLQTGGAGALVDSAVGRLPTA